MSPKGCLSITKYFLFLFNLLFFFLGSLILSFGLWILFDQQSFAAVLGSSQYALKVWSYILSGVGIITMLLGFLGCLGSLKEIKCMLGFYFGFLLLLFATQITIGVLLYTQRITLSTKAGAFVQNVIQTYQEAGPPSDAHESWDFIQEQPFAGPSWLRDTNNKILDRTIFCWPKGQAWLQCCGWNSYADWSRNPTVTNSSGSRYPCSCYNGSESSTNATQAPAVKKATRFCEAQGSWLVNREGCTESVQNWLTNNIITIVSICLGISLMELCLMMLSMFLFRNMGQNYDKLTRYS